MRRQAKTALLTDTPDFEHLARRVVLIDAVPWTTRDLSLVPYIAAALRHVWDSRKAVDQATIELLESRIANLEALLESLHPKPRQRGTILRDYVWPTVIALVIGALCYWLQWYAFGVPSHSQTWRLFNGWR